MAFLNWIEATLFRQGYGIRSCKRILNDVPLLASAAGYSDADLSRLLTFERKETPRFRHAEFVDHTSDVLNELWCALGGADPEESRQSAATRTIALLLARHKPTGVVAALNAACHENGF